MLSFLLKMNAMKHVIIHMLSHMNTHTVFSMYQNVLVSNKVLMSRQIKKNVSTILIVVMALIVFTMC